MLKKISASLIAILIIFSLSASTYTKAYECNKEGEILK